MTTKAEIRDMAAARLGILGEGETLPSYESADMSRAYDEVFAQLDAKNLLEWDYDEEIPDEYVPHVVALVAFSRANDYAITSERYSRLKLEYDNAIPEIRELQTSDVYDQPTSEDF